MIGRLSLVVSLLLFGYILSLADINTLQQLLARFDIGHFLIVMAIYFLFLLCKALRLHAIFNHHGGASRYELLHTAVMHNLYLSYLPFRLGDVLFADLCKRHAGLDSATAVAGLIAIRILDVTSLSVFLVLALALIDNAGFTAPRGALVLLLIVGALWLSFYAGSVIRHIGALVERTLVPFSSGFALSFRSTAERTAQSFSDMLGTRAWSIGFAFTLVGWISLTAIYWQLLRMTGVDNAILAALIVVTVQNLAMLLPIQTVAGLGVADAAIALSLKLAGLPTEEAISHALVLRLVMILLPFLFFLLFYTRHIMLRPMRP